MAPTKQATQTTTVKTTLTTLFSRTPKASKPLVVSAPVSNPNIKPTAVDVAYAPHARVVVYPVAEWEEHKRVQREKEDEAKRQVVDEVGWAARPYRAMPLGDGQVGVQYRENAERVQCAELVLKERKRVREVW